MKKSMIITAVVFIFLICSCVVDDNEDYFEAKLLGKWESWDKSVFSGKLDISYRYITIIGYGDGQIKYPYTFNDVPFRDIMKDITHRGYSKEGKIFIESGGSWKEGIPYTYWKEYSIAELREIEFIKFKFGTREEVLSKTDF